MTQVVDTFNGGPGDGWFPGRNTPWFATNVSGSTIGAGRVVMFDIAQTDSDTVSVVPGHQTAGVNDSIFNCVLLPDAAATKRGIMAVVQSSITAAGRGPVAMLGIIEGVQVDGSGTTITKGAALVANTAGALILVPTSTTDGTKIVGYLMATTSVTNATTATVLFNGFGWGCNAT